jgi:hypothetical protein
MATLRQALRQAQDALRTGPAAAVLVVFGHAVHRDRLGYLPLGRGVADEVVGTLTVAVGAVSSLTTLSGWPVAWPARSLTPYWRK